MNGGFTFTCTTGWASNTAPIVSVAGRVVEVLVVATGGGGGPGRFGAGGVFCIGFFAFDKTCFAGLLAAGVLVLFKWAIDTSARSCSKPAQITTGADSTCGIGILTNFASQTFVGCIFWSTIFALNTIVARRASTSRNTRNTHYAPLP